MLTTLILVALSINFNEALFRNPMYGCSYCSDGGHCCTLEGLNLTEETFKFDIVVSEETTKIKVIDSNIPKLGVGLCRYPIIPFKSYQGIKELKIPNIGIEEVVPKAFHSCPKLEILILRDNKIKSLSKELLEVHTILKYIDLSNNVLQILPEELFSDVRSLKELNLNGNHLKTFNPDLIKPCPALRELKLASNDLLELNIQKILDYAPELRVVAFNDNQMRCERTQQIKEILEEKQVSANLEYVGTGRSRIHPTKSVEKIRCLDDVPWAALHYIYIMGF